MGSVDVTTLMVFRIIVILSWFCTCPAAAQLGSQLTIYFGSGPASYERADASALEERMGFLYGPALGKSTRLGFGLELRRSRYEHTLSGNITDEVREYRFDMRSVNFNTKFSLLLDTVQSARLAVGLSQRIFSAVDYKSATEGNEPQTGRRKLNPANPIRLDLTYQRRLITINCIAIHAAVVVSKQFGADFRFTPTSYPTLWDRLPEPLRYQWGSQLQLLFMHS